MANVSNVGAGKPLVAGAIYRAPLGTTLPTDASTALGDAFKSLGYISEDGVVNARNMDSESTKAWGGDTVMSSITGIEETFNATFIEANNVDVLSTVYGEDNVTGTLADGITVKVNSKEPKEYVYVIDMIMKDNLKRIVIPDGKITEVGDVTYNDSEVVGFETTITALPDASGNTSYQYIKAKA